jgi:hypothetical protein
MELKGIDAARSVREDADPHRCSTDGRTGHLHPSLSLHELSVRGGFYSASGWSATRRRRSQK